MGLTETASTLFARHGRAMDLVKYGPSTTDPYGGVQRGPATYHPVTAVTARFSQEEIARAMGLIAIGDLRLFVSMDGLTVHPEINDKVRIDGVLWRVAGVMPITTDGEPIYYEMHVRRDPVA